MKRKRGAWKRAVSVLAICGLIAAQMFSGKIAVSYAEESDEQQKTEQEAEKPSEEVAKDDALDQAVSYTHLDVYKRQEVHLPLRKVSMTHWAQKLM